MLVHYTGDHFVLYNGGGNRMVRTMTTFSSSDELRGETDRDQFRLSVSGSIAWFLGWAHPPFYDKHGEPMSEGDWSARFKNPSYQRIAYTRLPGKKAVRTVWLGYDKNPHRSLRDSHRTQRVGVVAVRPMIFETRLLSGGKPAQLPFILSLWGTSSWH
jgi:hypothetical protein